MINWMKVGKSYKEKNLEINIAIDMSCKRFLE